MNYILIFILLMYIPKQLPFCDLRDAQLDMCAEIYTSIATRSLPITFPSTNYTSAEYKLSNSHLWKVFSVHVSCLF